ncbi:YhdB family protein [Fervidibacillus halotolerans]|uniref:YhdB family protein n=1 Tax=Fervidibacillus halotolerans TaxID=2980027 RepID=A0A9E8M279_9BACI|nr:YhdB family protein [Fervidibacillus halotolerans]WAA12969.1 YhdB family protein [Fervidibacillus halotolerans]
MKKADYDRALYYTFHSQWDNLLVLMVRTRDDLLSKKIEQFLHAYYFQQDDKIVKSRLMSMLDYVEHANMSAAALQDQIIHSV